MNHETMLLLERHFDTAFAAPDGIQKLRELILTLAMQGKLVPQDPNDQPASELLKAIEAEKIQLVKEGKIKQPKPLPDIRMEEIPYELPLEWAWVRLGKIGEINPRNICDDDTEAGFVPMPLIFAKYGSLHKFEPRKWAEIKKGFTHFADGDVALAKITPCFENGKSCVFDGLPNGIGAGTTELHIFRNTFNSVYPEYLLAYLKDPKYIASGTSKMTGSAGQKRVPTDFFKLHPFPLPPLAEQRRIVAKIDQLMARCDELEKLRSDRAQKLITVHTAALDRLLTAKDNDDFSTAWHFITQHFDELYSVKATVAELRKTILQLAVMGKLVPQDPNDEPASELLKAIELEKQRLVKEGKIKQPKPLPEIDSEEIPYDLPKGWKWVQFGNVANSRLGKMLDKSKNQGKPRPYLRNTNVQWHCFNLTDIKQMKFEDEELDEFRVMPGDLLICEGGEPGRCAIWLDPLQDIYFQKALHRVRPFSGISAKYLQLCLTIDAKTEKLNQYFTGATIRHFPGDKLIKYVIPLPPLAEQHRIVAKIDQLMALFDRLEGAIASAQTRQTDLLNAVMAQV